MPRIRELGLTLPDPELRLDEATGEWRYTEPDWNELRTVVTSHGPKSQERLAVPARPNWDRTRSGSATRSSRRPARGRRVTDQLPADRGATRDRRAPLEPWEVFRQEKDGDPMRHGGIGHGARRELALHYAREMYSRRQESVQLWVVRRADIHDLADPDLLQPPLDRSFKKPGGYVMRDKLAAAARASRRGQAEGDGRSDRLDGCSSRSPMDFDGAGDGRERRARRCCCCRWPTTSSSSASRDSEWTGIAPILEEDVAISSLAQDELGHAQALYELLADVRRRRPRRRRDRLRPARPTSTATPGCSTIRAATGR